MDLVLGFFQNFLEKNNVCFNFYIPIYTYNIILYTIYNI